MDGFLSPFMVCECNQRQLFQNIQIVAHPGNRFLDSLLQADPILPTQRFSRFGTVQQIGRIFSEAFPDDIDPLSKST